MNRVTPGGIGPEYAPLSKAEESFYIRTKIVNAIQQQSLLELRRALGYALASGIDPENLELEVIVCAHGQRWTLCDPWAL